VPDAQDSYLVAADFVADDVRIDRREFAEHIGDPAASIGEEFQAIARSEKILDQPTGSGRIKVRHIVVNPLDFVQR
jgi:hypothetical protein